MMAARAAGSVASAVLVLRRLVVGVSLVVTLLLPVRAITTVTRRSRQRL